MDLYDKGEKLYIEGKYEEAIKYFQEASQKEDDKVYSLNYIGCCYIYLGRYQEALKIFDEILKSGLWERVLFNKGRVYLKLGNYNEALINFLKAQEVNPNNSDVYYYLGVYYDKVKDYETARVYYEKAIDINDEESEYHLNLGVVCFRTNDFDRAISELDLSISLDNNNADTYFNKGYVLYRLKNYKDALKSFKRASYLIPYDTEIMNMITNCYLGLKEYEDCLIWINRILNIDSSDKEALAHKKIILKIFERHSGSNKET